MKYIVFLILIYTNLTFAQGKFDGGDASGYNMAEIFDQALPIEFEFFNANLNQTQVDLSWYGNLVQKGDMFLIQKSSNNIIFNTIGSIHLRKPNFLQKPYIYTDFNPYNGVNFYRIKHIDLDNKITYSKTTMIRYNNPNNLTWEIYPLPFHDEFIINTNISLSNRALNIYDLNGNLVQNLLITTHRVTLNNLPSGMYYFEMENQIIKVQKL